MKPQFPQKKMTLSELYQSEIKQDDQEPQVQINSGLKFKFDPNFSDKREKMSMEIPMHKSSILEEYQKDFMPNLNEGSPQNMNSDSVFSQIFKNCANQNQQNQQISLSLLNASSFKPPSMSIPLIGSRIISPIGGKRQTTAKLNNFIYTQPEECQISLYYAPPKIGITYCLKDDYFITIVEQVSIKNIRLILDDYDIEQLNVFYSREMPEQMLIILKQTIYSAAKFVTYQEVANYNIQESLEGVGFGNPEIYDLALIDKPTSIKLCSALPVLTKKNVNTILNLLADQESRCKLKFNEELLTQLRLIKQDKNLSVQTLFEPYFKTLQGQKIFNEYLRNPISSQQILLKRFSYLSCFQQMANSPSHRNLFKEAKQIGSCSFFLKSLANYQDHSEYYQKLYQWLDNLQNLIQEIKNVIRNDRLYQEQTCQLLKELSNQDLDRISQLKNFIGESLNFRDSKEIIIKKEKYPQYARLFNSLTRFNLDKQLIKDRFQSDLAYLGIKPEFLDIEYIKDSYYLVITSHFDIANQLEVLNWNHFQEMDQNNKIYYQTMQTELLDEKYGNIHQQIEIVQEIISHKVFLEQIELQIGEIDYYIGLSAAIKGMNLCIPKLNNNNRILISGGRHLLVEKSIKQQKYVSNHFDSTLNKRIFVIVGPNASGKSVFIRQIGLILYLAHCGLPVPAESIEFFTLEEIITAFPCEGSQNQNLNLIDQQLMQIKSILQVSSRSLVLMDEIGKNFKYQIGSNLHKSALEYFSSILPSPPIVLSATHYQHDGQLDNNVIQQGEMLVTLESDKNLKFAFEIQFGKQRRHRQSFGLQVALMVHNNEDLYKRGLNICENLIKKQYLSKPN